MSSVLLSAAFLLLFKFSSFKDIVVLIVLLTTVLFAFLSPFSKKTWIPIIISLLLFRDLSMGSFIGGGTLKLGDMFIAWLFGLWFLSDICLKNSTKIIKNRLDLFLLGFIVLHFISLLWSTDTTFGLVRCLKLTRNFMFFILIRELMIMNFWDSYRKLTASYVFTSLLLLVVYLTVVLISGGFDDFLSLYQKKTLTSLDLGALRVRGTGAGFLISGPAMWFMITGAFVFGSIVGGQSYVFQHVKIFYSMIMFTASTVLTLARSVFGMFAILISGLLIGSIFVKSKKLIWSISVIFIIFAVAGTSLGLTGIYAKRFTNAFKDGSWIQREEMYDAAIGAFKEHPVIGIGAGANYTWQLNYPDIGGNRSRIVHSAYMLVLSELGLVGMTLFGAVIFLWLWYFWGGIRSRDQDDRLSGLCMVLLIFSISYLAYITIVGEFEAFEPWLLMAIASAVKSLCITEADNIEKPHDLINS